MKKNVLKKLMCAVLAAACVATAVVPAMADDVVTAEAATKKVTSAYKYHLEGYDKKGNDLFYSKTSFYNDLNSLPAIKTGKTTINVPAVTASVKSLSKEKDNPCYRSFLKFKVPKTGKYVITCTNLQGTDTQSVKILQNIYFDKVIKNGKKYGTESISVYTIGDYEFLYENNYLARLRTILDNYKAEHPEYADAIDETYNDESEYVSKHPVNKIKFTTRLKKGQTYVFVIDNRGMAEPCKPYLDDFGSDHQSCLSGGNYLKAYSFDMNIEYKK